MARKARLHVIKNEIEDYFNNCGTQIFTLNSLREIFSSNRKEWKLPKSDNAIKIIKFLTEHSKLKEIYFDFSYNPTTRYIWGKIDLDLIFQICLTLRTNAYLSHYTALYIHNLTEQIPKNIYISFEQTPKPGRGELTQENIDKAFKRPQRQTKSFVTFMDYKITAINSKFTESLGVERILYNQEKIRISNIERTLIDITVRPAYAGGVFEIIKAYKLAKDRVSVNRLNAYLKKIDYIYPYHQAIGFYLERAGYPENRLKMFDKDKVYDFYLTHQISDIAYSKRWKLYYPKSLD